MMNTLANVLSRWLLAVLDGYQKLISPVLPARCRYYPTCSQYSKQAIHWHGSRLGLLLTLKRLSRCHPFGGSGIDFVPLPLYQEKFTPINVSLISKAATKDIPQELGLYKVSCETLLIEHGVYVDRSSYTARLNYRLRGL